MKQFEIKVSNSEVNYEEAVMYMESRVDGIINNKSEELIWFLNHNHIFTQGTSASKKEILNSDIIDIIKSKSNNISFDKEKKIGAIGLRIKKWITYHGLSFNINPDLNYYNYIHSCGLKEYKNTSMEELGIKLEQSEFDNKFKKIFLEKLKTI